MNQSLVYKDGDIIPIDEYYNNNPFFRKYVSNTDEIEIVKILMKNPHDNICNYYRIADDNSYIDMELLDVYEKNSKSVLIDTANTIKNYLQSIGIIYIDWKKDHFGRDIKNNIKIFDFDSSGIIDLNTNEWIIEPSINDCWSYKYGIDNGLKNPFDIDNFSFHFNFS